MLELVLICFIFTGRMTESDSVMTSCNDDDDVDDAVCLKVDELRRGVVLDALPRI